MKQENLKVTMEEIMWFEVDARGIKIKLRIKGYTQTTKENWDSEWCNCDFLFLSEDWLNYHREDTEVLLSCEVEELEENLSQLLNNQLSEEKEILCMEPDFIFKLYPQKDRREDPNYTYVQPGYEIQDIYLEWKVYFWHGGLTDNYLTVTLNRDEIESLRDYLSSVIKN